MKKKFLLICNRSLLSVMPVAVASGVLLEWLHGCPFCGIGNAVWTWLHVVMSGTLLVLVLWHVHLNWHHAGRWYRRFREHRSMGFKCMAVFFLLAALTGLVSVPLWLSHGHSGIGGLHGKIGYVWALFALGHTIRHRKGC